MPNGDKKVAVKKPQEKAEKPIFEHANENYFKKVNEEFEKIVQEEPEKLTDSKLIDDIAHRNEKSFQEKVIDALKSPGEALKWGGNMLKTYAASWLAEIFGLKKYITDLKDKILDKTKKAKEWVDEKKKGMKEKLEDLKKDVEPHPEYELEDFEKALGNYYTDIKEILIPIKQFAVRNRLLLSVLGTVMMVKHFDRIKNAAIGSKDFFLGLAKMPWPKKLLFMGSVCGSTAVLLYLYKTQELGKIKVPKDSRNFAKWLQSKFENEKEKIQKFLDDEGLPDLLSELPLHISAIDDLAQGKKRIKAMIESPEKLVDELMTGAKELARQNSEKFVRDQNRKGLESFISDIDMLALRPSSSGFAVRCLKLQNKIREIIGELKNELPFTKDHKAVLEDEISGLGLGFELIKHDGFLVVRKRSDPKHKIIVIAVNPLLSKEEQFEKAWKFWPETEGAGEALQKVGDLFLEQLRFALDQSFEAFEYKENAPNLLMRILRGGAYLVFAFEKVALIKGTKEYYIGPWELVWNIVQPLVSGKEFSAVEFATEWEGMILPVFCLGVTKHIVVNVLRGRIKEGFLGVKPKNILAESAVYPVIWTGRRVEDGMQMTAAIVKGQFSEFIKNKLYTAHDGFFEFMARVKYRRSWIPGKFGKAIAQERWVQANLWEALALLRDATNKPLLSEPPQDLIDKARRALKAAGKIGDDIAFADKSMAEAKKAMAEITEKIKLIDDQIMLMKATGEIEVRPVEGYRQESAPSDISDTNKGGSELERQKRLKMEQQTKELETRLKSFQQELEQKKRIIIDTAISKGKSIADPDILKQIRELNSNFGPKISEVQENLKQLYHGLYPEFKGEHLPKAGHPPVPEIPTPGVPGKEVKPPKPPSRIRRLGLHFLGLGGGVMASAMLGVGIGRGLEALQEKEDEFSIEPIYQKQKSESEKSEKGATIPETRKEKEEGESMKFLEDYGKSFNSDYEAMFSRFTHQNLLQYEKEDSLHMVVSQMAEEHGKIVEKMKAFLNVKGNQELLFRFYERLAGFTTVDVKKPKKLTDYFAMSYDPSRHELIFHYADEGDFENQMYDYADFVLRHDGKTEATQSDLVKDAMKYATPGLGIYMDARDTYNAVRRGKTWRAVKSGFFTGIGAIADLAMLTGAGALITGAVRGGILAAKTGRAAKVAMAAGVGAGALDVAWQAFTPKHSQILRIKNQNLFQQFPRGDIAPTSNQ